MGPTKKNAIRGSVETLNLTEQKYTQMETPAIFSPFKYVKLLLFRMFGSYSSITPKLQASSASWSLGSTLIKNIQQPHSLKTSGDNLYFVESKTSTVFKNLKPLFSLTGYLRGLDIQKRDILIGSSKSRNSADEQGSAKLLRVSENGQILNSIEFIGFNEIYDVVAF